MSRIYDALKKLEAERARKAGEERPTGATPQADAPPTPDRAEPAHVAAPAPPEPVASAAPEAPTRPPAPEPLASPDDARTEAVGARESAAGANGGAGANGHGAGTNGNAHAFANGNGANGHGANGNGGNGHGANGSGGNGHGPNGNGHGKRGSQRRGWRWLFPTNGNGHSQSARPGLTFDLGPEVEDAYQRLGTNLLIAPGADTVTPRLLGLTASRHGEGTTTTTVVFASVLARRRGGRVAVVEANFRSPSLDTILGIRRDAGLADLVQGRKSVAEVAQPTEIPNLFAICCGQSTLGPPALFDSSGIGPALDALRSQFDFVLIDLPPANLYGDTSILSPRLDGALVVIEADRARIPEVERLRRNLERVGARIVGSILNRKRSYIPAFIEEML